MWVGWRIKPARLFKKKKKKTKTSEKQFVPLIGETAGWEHMLRILMCRALLGINIRGGGGTERLGNNRSHTVQ